MKAPRPLCFLHRSSLCVPPAEVRACPGAPGGPVPQLSTSPKQPDVFGQCSFPSAAPQKARQLYLEEHPQVGAFPPCRALLKGRPSLLPLWWRRGWWQSPALTHPGSLCPLGYLYQALKVAECIPTHLPQTMRSFRKEICLHSVCTLTLAWHTLGA